MASYNQMPLEVLKERAEQAVAKLESCDLCPRACGVNRLKGLQGVCRGGRMARIASFAPHFGEESPLVGSCGSGAIFFAGCNLGCIFCQNYEISQDDLGENVSADDLAKIMIHLQRMGCHNINLVTPTHFVPQILEALIIARARGLNVPLVYNCGGYESVETLRLLDGIVDIYMPDMKYGSDEDGLEEQAGQRYSHARDYAMHARAAIKEMHRQVGDLVTEDGLAVRGIIVRHLVLPEGIACTKEVVEFLSGLSKNTYLNVMAQYRPAHEAEACPELSRCITASEFGDACKLAADAGLTRGLEI